MTDRRHALAFNALGSAINATGHWLPFTARKAAVDAVLTAVDAEDQAARTAARQTTGQDDTEPLPPRADRCPEPECAEGRECWRCDYEESQHAARRAAPAVGQPAEAHDTDEAEILARAASDLCAFGHGEAAAFLRDRVKALMGPGAWVPQYGRPLTPEEQDAETLAAADTVEDER